MTAPTARALRNGLLLIGLGFLAVDFAAMAGWLKIRDHRSLWMFAFVCFLFARIIRRQAASSGHPGPSS